MQIQTGDAGGAPVHLTYCLNIHPGESWSENLHAIRTRALAVRDAVGRGRDFGLGLRLSRQATEGLLDPANLAAFCAFLRAEGLYVFTVNGFPYGQFHGTRVKENVYAPDWQSCERVEYTLRIAEVLAALLPEGVTGSISSLPGSYRPWCLTEASRRRVITGVARTALGLATIAARTGRCIRLALEPEPDCLWDSTAGLIEALARLTAGDDTCRAAAELGVSWASASRALAQHLGVCLDTCHQAVCFETVADSLARLQAAGVAVAKVQVSAAPIAERNTPALRECLARFCDPVYLHQCRVRLPAGTVLQFEDLPGFLAVAAELPVAAEVRTHVHIPLSISGWQGLGSTRQQLDRRFFDLLRGGVTPHVELETYTFSVLPEELQARGVEASLVAEFAWFLQEWASAGAGAPAAKE